MRERKREGIRAVRKRYAGCVIFGVRLLLTAFLLATSGYAQLVENPQAIPRTGNPPVVFLNGFETNCGGVTFAKEFGIADQVLQANGRASLFFNNCNVSNASTIEALGSAFGAYLQSLRYSDGGSVDAVDAIGYSMGGLIVRCYLSGKQVALGTFSPPASIPIRKAVFIASPNFGSPVGALAFGAIPEADEMSSGSSFLMDLNTWNQNHDDLRGIDAIAIAGTGGTGLAVSPGFDDGLIAVSSASLGFYGAGRTRVLPLCHQAGGTLSLVGLCPPNARGIAQMTDANGDNTRIVVSFLTGTTEWQSIGTAVEDFAPLKNGSGIEVRARTAGDQKITPSSIVAAEMGGAGKSLNMSNNEIGWTDLITAGPVVFTVNAGAQSFTQTVDVAPGGAEAIVLKPGPEMAAAIPAPAVVRPVVVAPGMIVSVYGSGLDGASLSLGGIALRILYNGPGQINAVMPGNVAPGLATLTLTNAAGSQTLNAMVEPAFPAVFTLGGGAAAAVDARTGAVVGTSAPLHGGDYVELYLTGLGGTIARGGLDYAAVQPTVTIGGQDCPVSYAGGAPGFAGLDQINCVVPVSLGAGRQTVVVTSATASGVRSSVVTYVDLR